MSWLNSIPELPSVPDIGATKPLTGVPLAIGNEDGGQAAIVLRDMERDNFGLVPYSGETFPDRYHAFRKALDLASSSRTL